MRAFGLRNARLSFVRVVPTPDDATGSKGRSQALIRARGPCRQILQLHATREPPAGPPPLVARTRADSEIPPARAKCVVSRCCT